MPNNEVDAWFDAYRHPQKDQMQRLRKAILAVDARIEECIKWSCPTFTYRGNLVSFNPRATKKISLQFHRGAEIPGRFEHLDGSGKLGRNMSIADLDDLNTKLPELTKIVSAWVRAKSATTSAKRSSR